MPIRARVGRHTRLHGRHCQNWTDDQKVVIGLLNRIDFKSGGAQGSLGTQVVNGVCDAPLYSAISRFEDKYFPGQRSGFVDPGGAMLNRMERLATPEGRIIVESVKSVPTNFLPALHAKLLDESQIQNPGKLQGGKWTFGDRVQADRLVDMAIKHINNLLEMNMTDIPWPVELFGRAYITRFDPMPRWGGFGTEFAALLRSDRLRFINMDFDSKDPHADDDKHFSDFGIEGSKAPPLPEMQYGHPAPLTSYITTAELPALLLFKKGECYRVASYASGKIQDVIKYGYDFGPVRIVGRPDD